MGNVPPTLPPSLPPKASVSRGLSLGPFGAGPFGGRRGGGGGRVQPSDRDRGVAEARAGEEARGRGVVDYPAPTLESDGIKLCKRVAGGVRDLRDLGAHVT